MKIGITLYAENLEEAADIITTLKAKHGRIAEIESYAKPKPLKHCAQEGCMEYTNGPNMMYCSSDDCPRHKTLPTYEELGKNMAGTLDKVIKTTLEAARKNVSPGEPSIGKIGGTTKDSILRTLKEGLHPVAPKFEEHLKLLWKRGEVKFDGTEYWL